MGPVFTSTHQLEELVASSSRKLAPRAWRYLMQSILTMMKLLTEAAVRIEKKLDELLRLAVNPQAKGPTNLPAMLQPLNNPGQATCPLCQRPVVYLKSQLPDLEIVVRTCGCEPQVTQIPNQGV
jgi:hypothetical protein